MSRCVVLILLATVAPSCRREAPVTVDFSNDRITHLQIQRADAPEGSWVRIGDPQRVDAFQAWFLGRCAEAKVATILTPAHGTDRLFLKWTSGRECTCTMTDSGLLRFWHLAAPLNPEDRAYLSELLESVRPADPGPA